MRIACLILTTHTIFRNLKMGSFQWTNLLSEILIPKNRVNALRQEIRLRHFLSFIVLQLHAKFQNDPMISY